MHPTSAYVSITTAALGGHAVNATIKLPSPEPCTACCSTQRSMETQHTAHHRFESAPLLRLTAPTSCKQHLQIVALSTFVPHSE
ncbi:hypothetical protein GN956_G20254 [Arapaima gigas]